MKKNAMLVLLAIALLALSFSACAESAAPSITVSDVVVVVEAATTTTGEVLPETFVVDLKVHNEKAEAVLAEVIEFVQTDSIANFFGEEVMTTAVDYLPQDLDTNTLQMDEFFTLNVEAYEHVYGDVEVVFEFATEYEEGSNLLAMVGIMTENGIEWIPLKAEVIDGQVKVCFTQEVLGKVMENEAVFSLLRAA